MPKIPWTSGPDVAIDSEGHKLPFTAEQTREIVRDAIESPDSEIVAVILKHKGSLQVQVFGPPSKELLDILESTAKAYRSVVES